MLYNGSISKSEPSIYSHWTEQIKIINNITIYLHNSKLREIKRNLKITDMLFISKKKNDLKMWPFFFFLEKKVYFWELWIQDGVPVINIWEVRDVKMVFSPKKIFYVNDFHL